MNKRIQLIDKNGMVTGYADDNDINNVVADGCGVRVSAYLCDGVPMERIGIVDAAGRPSGSRPGFCFDADDNEAQARAAYDARNAYLADAWRGTAWTNAASNLPGAWRNTVSPPPPVDRTAAESAREIYKADLSNQWRTTTADAAPPVTDMRPVTAEDLEADRARRKQLLSEAWRTPPSVGFGGSFG